jgi:hypothetical protein
MCFPMQVSDSQPGKAFFFELAAVCKNWPKQKATKKAAETAPTVLGHQNGVRHEIEYENLIATLEMISSTATHFMRQRRSSIVLNAQLNSLAPLCSMCNWTMDQHEMRTRRHA